MTFSIREDAAREQVLQPGCTEWASALGFDARGINPILFETTLQIPRMVYIDLAFTPSSTTSSCCADEQRLSILLCYSFLEDVWPAGAFYCAGGTPILL